MSSRYDRPP
jgi:hypothetical protein